MRIQTKLFLLNWYSIKLFLCNIPDHASIISFVGDTSAIEYVNEYQSDMLETMCTLLMQLIAGMIVVIIHI